MQGLVNFKEFGKVYIKNKLDHDLFNNKILHDKRLDEPFTFPVSQTFQDKIAVMYELGRASLERNRSGLYVRSCIDCSLFIRIRLG